MRKFYLVIIGCVLSLLVACSGIEPRQDIEPENDNFNQTGFPIVDEPITLTFMTGKSSMTADDYNDVYIWKKYEEMTNIHIDWGLIPSEGLEYQKMLSIVTDEYPEVFYTAQLTDGEIYENGQFGVFLKLNDFIDKYMPNLKAILEKYPEIEKGLTFPDGNIYSLPTIYDPEYSSIMSNIKPYIKKDWLDKLDMDIPETTDDYYKYLKAVKDTDLIGNGKNDEIPFGTSDIEHLYNYLKGSFGIGNRGSNHQFLDIDPETEELRFYPATDEYKQLIEYMNKLFSEGLIEDRVYTMDEGEFQGKGSAGRYGSVLTSNPEMTFGLKDEYVGMPALTGPNGDKSWTFVRSPLASKGGFAITDKNDNIAATLRWMDYFYGEEGATLFFMGVEDETYEVDDNGNYEYMSDVSENDDLSLNHTLSSYFTYMSSGYPGMIYEKLFNSAAGLPSSLEANEKLEPDKIDEVWPPFTFTDDEIDVLMQVQVDLYKTVDEMRAKLIVGQASFDEWDDYIDQLEEIGLDDYMKVQQAAYERYKE